jgi:rhomboid family GlyGly-CTERM serine protease
MRPAILLVLIALAAVRFPALGDALAFDRAAVGAGQVWRYLTAHLAHDSARHFAWDASALLVLAFACERLRRGSASLALLFGFAVVSFVLLPLSDVDLYRGASALACSLFGCVAFVLFRDARRDGDRFRMNLAGIALAGLLLKSGVEALLDSALFVSDPATVPWPLAHLAGAAAGILAASITPPTLFPETAS